jgi:methanogenic corrinoid protein MtbC1
MRSEASTSELIKRAFRENADFSRNGDMNSRSNPNAVNLDAELMYSLAAAVLSHDRAISDTAVQECISRDISTVQLVDLYIPEVSRLLGARWSNDAVSFAEVTIGVARLQSLVRELDRSMAPPREVPFDAPSILLVIPPDTYHTLGAMVALSQFRRLGVSVRLLIARDANEVGRTVRDYSFDMVAISASGCERLEVLRLLVTKVKAAHKNAPPVVIGGGLLDVEPETQVLTGADFTTTDPKHALLLCGLKVPYAELEVSSSKV